MVFKIGNSFEEVNNVFFLRKWSNYYDFGVGCEVESVKIGWIGCMFCFGDLVERGWVYFRFIGSREKDFK